MDLELLLAGWVRREWDASGRETLRLTERGLQELAATRHDHRHRYDAHEALVSRVALEMQRGGRMVWDALSLRAPVTTASVTSALHPADANPVQDALPPLFDDLPPVPVRPSVRWAWVKPDVFSIRHTTHEDAVEPVVHEIKVRRADLLSDLKKPSKGEAYAALSSQCWYVLAAGIGEPEEIPPLFGVMRAHPRQGEGALTGFGELEILRPAPRRPRVVPLATWMALARATPLRFDDGLPDQPALGEPSEAGGGDPEADPEADAGGGSQTQ